MFAAGASEREENGLAKLKIHLAIEQYDRTLPLVTGWVAPENIDLKVEVVSFAQGRHQRMLDDYEFDACELSLSSYLMARARKAPLTGIPVFPRRLFSQSQMFVNVSAGIKSPQDLIGKRVGLISYQTTLSVLAKGDLAHEYGIPLEEVTWVTSTDEPVGFDAPEGIRIEKIPAGKDIDVMLTDGEIQALMVPRTPEPFVRKDPRVARLFPDAKAEEKAYFRRNGFYPIMHVVALKEQVARGNPWVAGELLDLFERAKQFCYRSYADPNWSHLAWGRHLFEEERAVFGDDPWPSGLPANAANLERFIQYSHNQGLIADTIPVKDLFVVP